MYLKDDLLELISFGESVNLEFKESLSKELRKEIKYSICAFANTLGGKILVGVADSGEVIGISYNHSILAQVQHFAREINPNLKIHVSVCDELCIIIIEIFKSDELHNINGIFFIREGCTTQKLISPDEIRSLFELKNKLSFDDKINNKFDIEKDFNKETFDKFIIRSKLSKLTQGHILENLEVIVNGKLLNAGVLFFCNKITKFFNRADIVCVLWKGTEKVDVIDMQEFNTDFVSNYENSFNYIVSKLNTNLIIMPMGRDSILELPEDALREALINSMVHRNYLSNGRIQIDIFYDRVEISNPGSLLFDKKELGKKSLARNPLLLDLAYRLDLVEKIGSGIARIKALCETNKTKVKFIPDSDWFTVVFERKIGTSKDFDETNHEITDKLHKIIEERRLETSSDWSKELGDRLGNGLGDRLGDTQLKILFLVILDKNISIITLAQKMKISTTAIEKNINTLKEKGFIKRIGSARSGHWEIIK